MRKKRLLYNTVSSFFLLIINLVSSFILPKVTLTAFGSDVNGLVNSITQFLGIISFLDLGVGAVVQSALYKPLADNDEKKISEIITSADKYFTNIGKILFVYVLFLVLFFQKLTNTKFGWGYTAALIFSISINYFAQYFLGVVNRVLLSAAQKNYISFIAQMIVVIGNTMACVVLIKLGYSIQIVKLTSSLIFLLQPLSLYVYVKKNYNINRHAKYDVEPITQKWNGIAQHIAAVVLDGTDIVVLTLFANLSDISVYSVYLLIVKGVKQLFMSLTNGITALIGDLYAKREVDKLEKTFGWVEWIIHTCTTLFFSITVVLIIPFIRIYTQGVNDANYIQPLFSVLIIIANGGHCLRLPYNIMILAAGHYKQTQNNYVVSAILNIVVSVLMVKSFGLVGVAIGTIVAMMYQTIWMAWYNSKALLERDLVVFVKQMMVDVCSSIAIILVNGNFHLYRLSYFYWVLLAVLVTIVSICVSLIINLIFYKERVLTLLEKIKGFFLGFIEKIGLKKKY